ncbi:MAG: dTMP kinase [Ignavibacteria bacterium]|nr:MAG: dTMP kinase [Ignavibacteria bacterium]
MFITFEGIDFSGKTTQITAFTKQLRACGGEVVLVREPGGTTISEEIRSLLLDPAYDSMDAVTEFLLFSSSRSQLVRETILPTLQDGKHVIADRFFDSSTAYQGYGRGLNIDDILHVHHLATHGLSPDITFFIDITLEESYRRRAQLGREIDRMERADDAFFERVRTGYLHLLETNPQRFVRIDGMNDEQRISDLIWTEVSSRLVEGEDSKEGPHEK